MTVTWRAGGVEQWRDAVDHSSSTQSLTSVSPATTKEGSWVSAAREGHNTWCL